MHIYLILPFLLTTKLVKAESPPLTAWNSANERTLHGPVPSFLMSLPCPSEGYFRHPKYCSQFYRCVDVYGSKGALSLFQGTCEPGLVFDEKISSCNWPDLSTPCSTYGISQQPVHPQDHPPQSEDTSWPDFPSPDDQENVIPQQVFEVFTEISSPRPSSTTEKFSQHHLQEQQPDQQEEIWEKLTQHPEQPELDVDQQQAQQEVQTDKKQHEEQVHEPQIQQEIQQTGHQQVEQHQPHIQQEIQQTSQQVEQQVQQEQQMVHPQEVRLVQQQVQQEEHQIQQQVQHQGVQQQQIQQHETVQQAQQGTSGSDWWIPDENSWTTKPQQQDVQNIITSEDLFCNKEGFFQHPGNCSKFYRCVRRSSSYEVFVFECPQFLVFNQSESACYRSDSQACVTHEAAYRSLRSKRSVSKPTDRLEALSLPCPEEGFYRHPLHCQVFYRCVESGQRRRKFSIHTFVCPKNLVFDEKKGTCDWPEKSSPCSDNSMSISRTTQQSSRTTRQPLRQTVPTTRQPSRQPIRATQQSSRTTRQPQRQPTRVPQKPSRTTRQPQRKPIRATQQPSRTTRKPTRTTQQQFRVTQQPSSKQKSKTKNDSRTAQVQRRPNTPRPGDQVQRRPDTQRPSNQGRDKQKPAQPIERTRTRVTAAPEVNCRSPGFFANRSDCSKYYKCVDRSGRGQYFLRYDFACPPNMGFDEVTSTCRSRNRVAYCKKSQTHLAVLQDDDSQAETTTSSEEQTSKSSSSGSSQGGDKECKEEGYFRDPQDCNKFYRCVDFNGDGKQFVRYDFSCPEGLVFDEENSVCNWPSSSPECNGEGNESSKSGGGDKGSESSSKDTPAPGGTESSQTESSSSSPTDSGEAPSDGRSTDSESKSTTASESSKTDSSSGESGAESSTSGGDGSTREGTSSTSGSSDIQCTEEGYFRHPDDCSKFYRCVDFKGDGQQYTRYDFECPEGLVFDEVNSVCNWPSSSEPCESRSSSGSSDSGGTTSGGTSESQSTSEGTSQGQSTSSQSQTDSSTSSSSTSATDSSTSSSSTSATDSSSSSGTDSTTSSPGEDRTEEETAESSDKDQTSSQTESSTSSTSDASTKPGDSSQTEGGDETTSSSSSSESESTSSGSRQGSDGECTEEGFFRNPDDCSKFYRCVDFNGDGKQFVRYDFDCPEGLVFDEVNSVCNWPNQSPPCDSEPREPGQTTTTASSGGTTDSSTDESSESTTTASSEGTSKSSTDESSESGQTTTTASSEETSDSTTDSQSTTSEATTSAASETTTEAQSETTTSSSQSSSSESQTTDSSSSETTSSEGSNECTEEGYFRDPEDCSKFHRCVDSKGDGKEFTRYDFQCPDGLVFDDTKNKCNWPEESPPCETGSGKEQTTEASKETESTTKSQETDSSPKATDSGDESTTTKSGTTSSTDSDECTEEGYFRDPEDCRKYYRCIQNDDGTFEKQEFSCEEDEVFDPDAKFCDKKELNPSCPDSTTEDTESTTEATESTTEAKESTTEAKESTTEAKESTTGTTEMTETTSETSTSGSSPPPEGSSATESEKSTTDSSSTGTESSSTSKSSSGKECTEEGFFRDPDDCNKFYRCVDFKGDGRSYVRYDFDCPEGLVFDEENSVCNWPSSVPECESSGTGKGTSSSEGGTSSSTTQTDSGSTSSTSSQETSTSASSGTSEQSTSASGTDSSGTTEASTSQGQSSTSSSGTTESQSESSTSSTTSSSSSSTSSGESKDIECTEEGFFRHPDDCTKFYRCVDFNGDGKQFVRYDFECPEGLVFDETISVCNWPQDSPPCETSSETGSESSTSTDSDSKESGQESTTGSTQSGTTQTSGSESSGQTTESTTSSKTTSSETGETTSSSSSKTTASQESGKSECEEEGFFRHPEDCRKYYRCTKNNETGELEKKEYDCPEGHVFDEEGRYCNAEELSPPCNSSESFECTEEGFFRDPEDCTKYIQCTKRNDSESYEQKRFQCPEDHVFDEEGRYCNAKELSPPCDDKEEGKDDKEEGKDDKEEGKDDTEEGKDDKEEGKEDKGDGKDDGKDESSTTSGEGTSEGQTDGDQSSSKESFECKEEGFFRDPEDCTKYYQCSKKNDSSGTFEKKKHSCPEDHVFDEEGRYCNSVDLAPPCDESDSSKTTSDDSSSSQTRTTSSSTEGEKSGSEATDGATEDSSSGSSTDSEKGKSGTTDSGGGSSTTASSTKTTSSGSSRDQGDKECKEEGFFRNPDDCNKFYRCVDFSGSGESFVRYDFDCPEGLVFDEINSVCTWPTISPPCENKKKDSDTLYNIPQPE